MADVVDPALWLDGGVLRQILGDGAVRDVPMSEVYQSPVFVGIDMARGVDGLFVQVLRDDEVVQILDASQTAAQLREQQIATYVLQRSPEIAVSPLKPPRNRHERRARAKGECW